MIWKFDCQLVEAAEERNIKEVILLLGFSMPHCEKDIVKSGGNVKMTFYKSRFALFTTK